MFVIANGTSAKTSSKHRRNLIIIIIIIITWMYLYKKIIKLQLSYYYSAIDATLPCNYRRWASPKRWKIRCCCCWWLFVFKICHRYDAAAAANIAATAVTVSSLLLLFPHGCTKLQLFSSSAAATTTVMDVKNCFPWMSPSKRHQNKLIIKLQLSSSSPSNWSFHQLSSSLQFRNRYGSI